MAGSAFHMATEKIVAKAKNIAAFNLKVDEADVKYEDGVFSSTKTNQTLTMKEIAKLAVRAGEKCRKTWKSG